MRTQSLVFVFIAVLALTQCALAFEDFYCGDNTCYEVLELTRSASTAEIKIAYKKLSLKYHPDKTDSLEDKERYIAVRQAYDTLIDDDKRREYDDILDHPERNFSNYARVYARYYRTSVISILFWTLAFATVCDWLYRQKRYTDMQYFVRQDRQVQIRIKAIKRDRLEKRAAEEAAATPSKKKDKKKLDINDIPDSDISLAELGIELAGPYSAPPVPTSVLPLRLARGLVSLSLTLVWFARFIVLFQLLKRPYGDSEREYLTKRALDADDDIWNDTEDSAKEELIKRELWIEDNMEALRVERRAQYSKRK